MVADRFASARPWTVHTSAASMPSLTTSAILGVVTVVEIRFMNEAVNLASRFFWDAMVTIAVGISWTLEVMMYSLSYSRCVRNSVVSRSFSNVLCDFFYLTQ